MSKWNKAGASPEGDEQSRPGPLLGRRGVGLLGAGLLAGCAVAGPGVGRANTAGRGGVVLADPLPCLARAEDLTGLLLQGSGRASGSEILTFGLPFRAGQMPRGATLAARGGSRASRVQLDVVTRHPDGTARFAVVSLEAAGLPNNARQGFVLSRANTPAEPALDLAAALSGRQAVVELTPLSGGGRPWRLDLLEQLRAAPLGASWQSGPLAVQRRISAAVPPEVVGGATSMRLVADIAARADGTLWVDVWFRNDIAMQPGGGVAAYSARVVLDGREALQATMPAHHQYRSWGRLLGALPGGQPAATQPPVRHDTLYLADTGAIAHYDLTAGVDETMLASMTQQMARPDWHAAFDARGIMQYMPTGGGRMDLGPTTGYQAAWLISGDPRAADYCIGQAEAAGTIPWHFWDPNGGADRRGGWLDAQHWPRLWTDGRGRRPPGGLAQQISGDTGWNIDTTHQPDLCFVPYLITGRRAFADEVMAQGAWNVLGIWPAVRNPPGMRNNQEGFLVVHKRQVRGAAWSIRQLDEAAWTAPDGDANQAYLRHVADRNWSWLREQIPAWTELQGELHGWLLPYELGGGGVELLPWQQDYFASAAAAAARQGNADARVFLGWMANFLVGRFNAADRGFARNDGAAFVLIASLPGSEGGIARPFRSWAEVGQATRARNRSNGDGWARSQGEYARLAMQSLAQLADILDHEGARRTYDWLAGAGAPFTDPMSFARQPTLNIAPRGAPRLPSRVRRCVPA
ncbi:hypothetical protein [Falsiroseomonas sp.]|uniref:hypothetical protein n=1 Tax=Falsiroseomonas sp. TaxID=2870721 RepID=UPI00273538FA|nr:hypothetical protein [Falsiroseomonas sp.]MDP3414438.1 hypothetical protein [Falsiroseomonas sp.]